MKVLKQGDIYAPEHLGRKDILIEGSRIARIADHIDEYDQIEEVEKVDLGGHILTPGYMDIHVHITGGAARADPPPGCRRQASACWSETALQRWWDFWAQTG